MDITPTREFLDDLGNRLEQIFDGDNAPIGRADILVLLKALRVATDIWRPVAQQDEVAE